MHTLHQHRIAGREFRRVPRSDTVGTGAEFRDTPELWIPLGLAREIASKPPLTVTAALAAIYRGQDLAIDGGLAIEDAYLAALETREQDAP